MSRPGKSRQAKVRVNEASRGKDSNSILLEALNDLTYLEAYQLEQESKAATVDQKLRELLNCAPHEHDRKTALIAEINAFQWCLNLNKFLAKRLRDEITMKGDLQAPGRED